MCPDPQSHFWLIQVLPILWSFSVPAIGGLCAIWTNLIRAVLWVCYSLAEFLSLCLCYGHCCGMQLWNQNSLNLAASGFLWEEYGIRSFSWNNKAVFALHPNEQKFSLQEHLPSHARGPSTIQTIVQDSPFSLIDPWISIPLEPGDKAAPHLK